MRHMGKRPALVGDTTHELDTRMVRVESRLDHIETNIDDIAKSVRALVNQPRAPAWTQIGATILTMCAIFSYVGSYLEGQYSKNVAVEKYRLEQVERKIDKLFSDRVSALAAPR